MIDLFSSETLRLRPQLIWMSGSPRDPMIRMLLAADVDNRRVYEGIALWSAYREWLGHFLGSSNTEEELSGIKRLLVRNKYVMLSELNIPSDDLLTYGLQRVDE